MSDYNTDRETAEYLAKFIEEYIEIVQNEFNERWNNLELNFEEYERFLVPGVLLARQTNLTINIANSPNIWNQHIGPIILRSMADVYINLAWIEKEALERSRKFIVHGLGQNKLEIEHRKNQLELDGITDDQLIKIKTIWAEKQKFTFLTDVNIGSWSGINTRKMAEEADCIDFYNYVYTPFSSQAHSMWNSVGFYDVKECQNPLHKYHLVPSINYGANSFDTLYLAGKYLNKTIKKFDEIFKPGMDIKSSFKFLCSQLLQDE